jgi:Protein of unknown function (DUF1688)
MQVDPSNPMTGISGRASLISNLAKALRSNIVFFGPGARPGNILGESLCCLYRFPDASE